MIKQIGDKNMDLNLLKKDLQLEKENPDDDIESLCNVSFPCLTDRITVFVGHQYDRCH